MNKLLSPYDFGRNKKAASFYRDGFSDIWNKFVII